MPGPNPEADFQITFGLTDEYEDVIAASGEFSSDYSEWVLLHNISDTAIEVRLGLAAANPGEPGVVLNAQSGDSAGGSWLIERYTGPICAKAKPVDGEAFLLVVAV